ncbi:MAG: nucleotide exchange factor GrpE [Lachnospiraceae bacterium]|nr:nucleotide exchange factor GrpE [Lachnospiraceae bacterium]
MKDELEDSVEEMAAESAEADQETDADEAGETAQDAEEAAESEETSEGKEKKKFFGRKDKKDKKDKQIEELNKQVEDLTDRVKRNMAEFDNFRKRTDKEKSAMFDMGAKAMIEKILPVIDNFERGLAQVPEDKKDDAFVGGMEMVYKQMLKSLQEAGLEQIEAVGKEFDQNLHNAVMHVEDENLGENVVANEFQKGYTYKGTVVRFSMVQVAN